jgi:Glyoxalase/Bleomycin resistance protein/Dioxygenase superfamily
MPIAHGVIKQLAYVVEDLDVAIARWVEVLHAGPFFRLDHVAVDESSYRGVPIVADLSLALGNSGGVQIELIALGSGVPSIYRERPHGVHHVAVLAQDFDAESRRLTSLGHPAALALSLPGVCRVRYHDTLSVFGHFVELWESTDAMRGLLEMVEAAAQDWDGRDPVRRLGG